MTDEDGFDGSFDGEEAFPLATGDAAQQVAFLLRVGQVRRAEEIAQSLIAEDPENPYSLLVMAQVLLSKGDAVAALNAIGECLKRAPDSDLAHYYRALALRATGRFREAEQALLTAIELDPEDADLHQTYARLLATFDESRAALEVVEHALELDPDDADAHALRAQLLLQVKPSDIHLSEGSVLRSLALDPENADAHAVQGLVRLSRRDVPGAESAFREALLREPGNELAFRGLAEAVMASSPLYRPFLWYSLLMSRASTGVQLLVVASLWFVANAFSQAIGPDHPKAQELFDVVYLALCAYTWFARPITRALVARRHPWIRSL